MSKSARGGEDLLQIKTCYFASYVYRNAKIEQDITVCKNNQIRTTRDIGGQIIGRAVGFTTVIGTLLVFYKNALKCGSVEVFNHQEAMHGARIACPVVCFGCGIAININELTLQTYKVSDYGVVDVLRILISEIFVNFIVPDLLASGQRFTNPFRPSFAVVVAKAIFTVICGIVLRLKFFYFFANGALGIQIILQTLFGNARACGRNDQFLFHQNLTFWRICKCHDFISRYFKQTQFFTARG